MGLFEAMEALFAEAGRPGIAGYVNDYVTQFATEIGFDISELRVPVAPGLERFFRDAGRPAPTRQPPPPAPPDVARLLAAAERYGLEILASPSP